MESNIAPAERILVCLSSSPSNKKVIEAAANMAAAFGAAFTALYVKPDDYDMLPLEDRERLKSNIAFAEEKGASVTTISGNDAALQIAEYARISAATKIVIGRSGIGRKRIFRKASLTDKLNIHAPNAQICVIPDSERELKDQKERLRISGQLMPTLKDCIISILILAASTGLGFLFTHFGFSEANIITIYILGVLSISVTTVSPFLGAFGSLFSVLLFNYFFIDPKHSFHTYEPEYAVTFFIMLIASLITGSLANRLKLNARISARETFRTKVLFDTNRLLQDAVNSEEVLRIAAKQVSSLLEMDTDIYTKQQSGPIKKMISYKAFMDDAQKETIPKDEEDADKDDELRIADWVFEKRFPAGSGTKKYSKVSAQYHPIAINDHCYGVISVHTEKKSLDHFSSSVFTSILGECAMALESLRNAEEKEKAAIIARNEQLRSNLLRSISHDIRTPLTSISGNASNLLSHYEQLDKQTLLQIFSDIYDDSEWLIDLVENLLFISRIENGQMELHLSLDVISDVLEESLKHIDKRASEHNISVVESDELLLAKMDSKLITQVMINLINNAIKNTPRGSNIQIISEKVGGVIMVSVKDDGPGIDDDKKEHVFDMFYTGDNKVADGRRGLGLGLALCKSIVEAHGGRISLKDNKPSGCCFSFTLPSEEIIINE